MLGSPESLSEEYPQPGEILVILQNCNTAQGILESVKPTKVGSNRNGEVLIGKIKTKQ